MMTEVACFMCQGTGRTWDDKPCPECGGRGWIEEDEGLSNPQTARHTLRCGDKIYGRPVSRRFGYRTRGYKTRRWLGEKKGEKMACVVCSGQLKVKEIANMDISLVHNLDVCKKHIEEIIRYLNLRNNPTADDHNF